MIFLLDLNFTLVANSQAQLKPFTRQIDQELYRLDLIEALAGERVFLCTARPAAHRERTLARISELTAWQPERAYFNEWNAWPPVAKRKMLLAIRADGFMPGDLYAIESNPATRAMYQRAGIGVTSYPELIDRWRHGRGLLPTFMD